jgi:hypothetical protein
MPTEEKYMETLVRGLHNQATAKATVGYDFVHVPTEEFSPALTKAEREFFKKWWDEAHPPPPTPPPDLLVWQHDINFPDWYAAAGGWSQLSLHSDGNWNFSGHLHDSGFTSYGDSVVWAVHNLGTDETYLFPHGGHMDGTAVIFGRNRDDDWNNTGTNNVLTDSWEGLFKLNGGYHVTMKATVNTDLKDVIEDAKNAVGIAAAVIAFL